MRASNKRTASTTALRILLQYSVLIALFVLASEWLLRGQRADSALYLYVDHLRDLAIWVFGLLLLYHSVKRELLAREQAERSLRRVQASLDRAFHHVELTVEKRTAELAATNDALKIELDERRRAEAELAALLDFSQHLESTLDLRQLHALVLDHLAQMVGYTTAAIVKIEDGDAVLQDYRAPEACSDLRGLRRPLAALPGYRAVVDGREPAIFASGDGVELFGYGLESPECEPLHDALLRAQSWLVVPLTVEERTIGLLRLDHDQPGYFTPHHAKIALLIANQAAAADEHAAINDNRQQAAVWSERRRIARDLHDSLSQVIYGLVLASASARDLVHADLAQAVGTLDQVHDLAESSLVEMRALIQDLHPKTLTEEGLVRALERQATAVTQHSGIEVQTHLCPEPAVSLETKVALLRIAQEALNNAVKHANAHSITLDLARDQARLMLEVCDDGTGFDPALGYPGHLGLESMRERAHSQDGRLEIHSGAGAGTRVYVEIPLTV